MEKRGRCDNALLRAHSILQQMSQLTENMTTLTDDFSDLDTHFEHVANLNAKLRREVEQKKPNVEYQAYLGRLIAILLGTRAECGMDRSGRFYFPCEWMKLLIVPKPSRTMPRFKRRLLKTYLSGKGY
ncbi:hypothetical protein ACOMHN_008492 [Nucella lapillus]